LEDATSIFIPSQIIDTPEEPTAEVVLTLKDQRIVINEHNTPFTFGRGAGNNIVIPLEATSRSHAKIENHYGNLVFVDHSTNGSYIITVPGKRIYDGIDMHLLHKSWTMMGRGSINFGKPISKKVSSDINFMVREQA